MIIEMCSMDVYVFLKTFASHRTLCKFRLSGQHGIVLLSTMELLSCIVSDLDWISYGLSQILVKLLKHMGSPDVQWVVFLQKLDRTNRSCPLQQCTFIDINMVIHKIMWGKLVHAEQHHLSLQHSGLHQTSIQLSLLDTLQTNETVHYRQMRLYFD